MGILEIIILLAIFSNFTLGLFVFLKDPSKLLNRLFGIFSLFTTVWILTNFMMGFQQTLFWLKNAYAFGALVPISALFWVLELCQKKITKSKIFFFSFLGFIFFIISYINN
ncbi:MAG: hypothetical protein QME61_00730, partial [Patescibacteria group bacterium]|nr:hypothetical protein [Patescibacteria group bacterium]